jgi:hypothetical protein
MLVRVVHGSPRSVIEGILSTACKEKVHTYLAVVDKGTIDTGHTHLSLHRSCGRWRTINPGAAGLPGDGLLTASYMLLHRDAGGWRLAIAASRVAAEPIFGEHERQGSVEECGMIGHLCIEAVRTARPRHSSLRWRTIRHPDRPPAHGMLEEYRAVCDWRTYVDAAYHINV